MAGGVGWGNNVECEDANPTTGYCDSNPPKAAVLSRMIHDDLLYMLEVRGE